MDVTKFSVLMIAVAASLWGVIGIFSRLLSDAGLTSLQITVIRCFIAAMIMFLAISIKDRGLFRIDPRDIWMFFGTGLFSIAIFNVLYFEAAELVSLSMTAVLLYTAPFFVFILSSMLFRERITVQKLFALVFAFIGCIFTAGLLGGGQEFNLLGFFYGLLSGITYSFYTIIGKFALRKYHPLTMMFYTFLTASVPLLLFADPSGIVHTALGSTKALAGMLGLGIMITAVPYFLYSKGLEGLEPGKASVLAFIEPMVATIAGMAIYGEVLTMFNVIGIFLILSSVVLLNIDFGKSREVVP